MPIYEYDCPEHGVFELIRGIATIYSELCPLCGSQCLRKVSVPAPPVSRNREQLPYGTGSRGKFVPAEETGGLPIFVPSWGAMEKEEVDFVAEAAVEKERERVANNRPHNEQNEMSKQALSNVVSVGKKAKEGERLKTIDTVNKEGLR